MSPKIHAEFWTDPDLDDVSPEVRLTLLWMISNPMTHFTGAFQIALKRFSFETGLDGTWLEETLNQLPKMFVRDGDWVWLRTYIKHQFGHGVKLVRNNMGKSVAAAVWDLPVNIRLALWLEYPELKPLASPAKPLASPSEGLASPSQVENNRQLSLSDSHLKPSEALTKPSEGVREGTGTGEGTSKGTGNREGTGEGVLAHGHYPEVTGELEPGEIKLRYDLAAECLNFLGKKTGADFSRASHAVLLEPAMRLHEVNYDLAGVERMIERQAALWGGPGRMAQYLRPATLFESVKFHGYYAQRNLPVAADADDLEGQRRLLQERIDTCRANSRSTWHSPEATEEERLELKKWRGDLELVNKKLAAR